MCWISPVQVHGVHGLHVSVPSEVRSEHLTRNLILNSQGGMNAKQCI